MVKYHRRDEVVQKEVIESNAKKVGVVKELAYTLDGKMALVVDATSEKGEPREGFLSFDKIVKIGDVILIKSSEDLEIVPVVEKLCPNCKGKNPVDSTFCFKCGVTLKK
ncbi:PRC-barrel domain-containing protein [[Eubacterium] cellulosolvens]